MIYFKHNYVVNPFKINVLGVDTPSTDPGHSKIFPCHILLQTNNIPLMEYVANLDSIPVRNTTIMLGAMKVRGGTGGPTRVFAFIEDDVSTSAAEKITPIFYCIFTSVLCSFFM